MVRLEPDKLWFTLDANNRARWLRAGSAEGEGDLDHLAAASRSAREVVWVLEGREVSCLEAELPPVSAKLQAQALPFAMEDQVLGPVESLLFASVRLGENHHGVAVTNRAALEARHGLLLAAGVNPTAIVPDSLVLPWREGEWTLLVCDQRAWLRCGQALGFSFEFEAWPAFLAQACASLPLPQRVRALGVTGEQPPGVDLEMALAPAPASLLEAAVGAGTEGQRGAPLKAGPSWLAALGTGRSPAATDPAGRPVPDFAPLLAGGEAALATRQTAREWRWVVGLLVGGLMAHGAFLWWQASTLEREVSAAQAANETLLRERFPEISRVVDVRAQASQALAQRQAGGASEQGLLARLSQLGPVLLEAGEGVGLASLEFDRDVLDLRIELPGMAAVDALQRALQVRDIATTTLSVETGEGSVRLALRVGESR